MLTSDTSTLTVSAAREKTPVGARLSWLRGTRDPQQASRPSIGRVMTAARPAPSVALTVTLN